MPQISVTLNGQPHRIDAASSLAELLDRAGLDAGALATAVNAEFVPRALRAQRLLEDGDAVLCFQAIVGG